MNKGDICLADSATTHIILHDKRYFLDLTLKIISETANLIEGSEKANILLANGT